METIISFLNENRVVFLATVENGAPRVRPFQFQFAQGGRLWFCTAKSKPVYAQLKADARLELSATAKNMATLRLQGRANLDDDMEVKRRIIAENALVRGIYASAENPDFTAFSVNHGEAVLFDFSGDPPQLFTF